jgi:ComF family protein
MWHLLFGSLCILCHQRLSHPDSERQLCRYCLADLPWQSEATLPGPDPIARRVVPLVYAEPVSAWVLKAKREGGLIEARVLGTLLAEAVREAYLSRSAAQPELMFPVPLSWQRLIRRGHNQAALIAEPLRRLPGLRLDRRSLRRIRHTPILPGQSAPARRASVAAAFECRINLSGKSVAIVDDVVTTGSTAVEIAGCLIRSGAREVHLWCPTGAPGAATL